MSEIEFGHAPMVKVTRGDAVESVHHGVAVVADSRGEVLAAAGNPEASTFLRSAAKPFQAIAVVASGAADHFKLEPKDLAVMVSSHNGEKIHLDRVRSILRRIRCSESDLRCGAHSPFYRPAAAALEKYGKRPTSLHNNCSGKHAGMLALSRYLGLPVKGYLSPDHPVQKSILEIVARYTGTPERAILQGVDGCSAPTFALTLRQAATGYARLVDPRYGPPGDREAAGRTVGAMRAHPEMVAGTGRLCTSLIQALDHSFIAKIGAEGFYGMAYRDGSRSVGIALKISDGNGERARTTAAVELLVQLNLLPRLKADRILARHGLPQVRNVRGKVVGRVAPLFRLFGPPTK
jgi:L-asparaginase II